jgi:hypothetical protein
VVRVTDGGIAWLSGTRVLVAVSEILYRGQGYWWRYRLASRTRVLVAVSEVLYSGQGYWWRYRLALRDTGNGGCIRGTLQWSGLLMAVSPGPQGHGYWWLYQRYSTVVRVTDDGIAWLSGTRVLVAVSEILYRGQGYWWRYRLALRDMGTYACMRDTLQWSGLLMVSTRSSKGTQGLRADYQGYSTVARATPEAVTFTGRIHRSVVQITRSEFRNIG